MSSIYLVDFVVEQNTVFLNKIYNPYFEYSAISIGGINSTSLNTGG
jgi:hypothetical protein